MQCDSGYVGFKDPNTCCATCKLDCTLVRCLTDADSLTCPPGEVATPPADGECCAKCVADCQASTCPPRPQCPSGSTLTTVLPPPGSPPSCCPEYKCDNCALLDCVQDAASMNCPAGMVAFKNPDECCASCKADCSLVDCQDPASLPCDTPVTKPGDCCPSCPVELCPEDFCPVPTCAKGAARLVRPADQDNGICCPVYECGDDCAMVDCIQQPEEMNCPPGSVAFKSPDQCCASCKQDCTLVKCANPDSMQCPTGGAPTVKDGECCATCPDYDKCALVLCVQDPNKMDCAPGFIATKDDDKCCATCQRDCSLVDCPIPEQCPNGAQSTIKPGECCASCPAEGLDCSLVKCSRPESCPDGSKPSKSDGQCCETCPDTSVSEGSALIVSKMLSLAVAFCIALAV